MEASSVFRTILAAVRPAIPCEFVIDFAISLAEQHHLAIDACSVIDLNRLAPAEPIPLGGGAFKTERDEQVTASARQKAVEMMSRVEAASRTRGVECRAQVREGDTVTILAGAVQRCDLLVCGHARGGDATEKALLHSILKHCPRPAIVVPQPEFQVGPNVLVAFDGSAQAARALASFAESGLASGRNVHIVSFDDGSGAAEVNAEMAQTFLHRHEISSDVRIGPLSKDAGSQILDAVERLSAGLIVMGAFGRSATREYFLGSVTRSILGVLPAPVFLDH